MRKLAKPDFSDIPGGWVDPDFFSPSVRRELYLLLNRSGLTEDQKQGLINFSNDWGQELKKDLPQPPKATRAQLEAVAANARRLLSSMAALSAEASQRVDAHTAPFTYGGTQPFDLPAHVAAAPKKSKRELLSAGWDWVQLLESAASHTASKVRTSKQLKPEQLAARGFVTLVAQHVLKISGQLPPVSRTSWFGAYMDCVGRHSGFSIPIGPRLVESGIKDVPR